MLSNSARGNIFRDACREILRRELGLNFEPEVPVMLGEPPKIHKFDLASTDRRIFVECRAIEWRANGEVPSAKIESLSAIVFWLRCLAALHEKVLCLKKATHVRKKETLGAYVVRLHRSKLQDVAVAEVDVDMNSVHWFIRRPQV